MITTYKRSFEVWDINDATATSFEKFKAPFDGRVNIAASYVVWDTEATGTQSGAQGVLAIEVGGVEVGTITAPISAALTTSTKAAVDGTYTTAASPYAEFSADDVVELKVKTQASGGTVTGEGFVYLAIDYAV